MSLNSIVIAIIVIYLIYLFYSTHTVIGGVFSGKQHNTTAGRVMHTSVSTVTGNCTVSKSL